MHRKGGDFVQVPFYKANLSGDFERLSDSSSLTPGKIEADKQVAAVLHRGRAFESRDLAALAAGSDPMAAIGNKIADTSPTSVRRIFCLAWPVCSVLSGRHQLCCLCFGLAVDGESGDTPTQLTARQVVEGQGQAGRPRRQAGRYLRPPQGLLRPERAPCARHDLRQQRSLIVTPTPIPAHWLMRSATLLFPPSWECA